MLVNATLAHYSDLAFRSAIVVYLLAMVLHAAEYAMTRVSTSVLVSSGGLTEEAPGSTPSSDPAAESGSSRPRAERIGRMAVALTVLAALLHGASLLARGIAAERPPWGNMYEFTSAICLTAVITWLVLLRRSPGLRRVGVFVLVPVVVLLFVAGGPLYAQAAPVVPALQSYWLAIHVSAVSISAGLLLVAGVASALFLLRRSDRWPAVSGMLPSAEVLDRLAYRTTVIAVPIFTFAIMAGAIWAESAWGRYWGWDPKETVAFVAWVVYAAYLHARATAGWRTGRAAWLNVAGFAVMLFNLFFINLVTAGLHSYAGVG